MPYTPTQPEAEGMLTAIRRDHDCAESCNSTIRLGDGHVVTLTCPWSPERLDMAIEADRRIVATVYADAARAALRLATGSVA